MLAFDPLDRVAERQAGDRRRRTVEPVQDPVDQPGIGEGAGAVMDQHTLGLPRRQCLQPQPNGVLPLGAAVDGP